jgi:hypothetical protein
MSPLRAEVPAANYDRAEPGVWTIDAAHSFVTFRVVRTIDPEGECTFP